MEDNATDETVNDKVSETDDVALEANVAKFGDLSSHILEKYRSSKGEGKLNDNEDGTKQKRESKLRDIASRRLSVSARAFANVVTRSIRENKTSKSVKINTMKFEVKNAPKTFNKFKKDPDLLLESLSFLHISDFMIFRSVCKQWSQVLGDGIASSSTLSITSRIQNLGYIPMSFREEDSNHDACADGSADHDLSVASRRRRSRLAFKRVDDHFVMPDTVRRVMAMGRAATSIRFSNVILDRSTLSLLRSFGTRIKSLSLGDIKVYKFTKTKAVEETTSDDESLASVETYGTAQKKSFSVRALPFMRGIHVKDVLGYCGTQLMFLELSVRIGPLPPGIFKSVPRLLSLTALDTVMGKRIKNEKSDIEGTVSLESFVASFAGIELPDLLQLMKDATNESLLLTDKRGNICVGNDAWERMSGYDSSQVFLLPVIFVISVVVVVFMGCVYRRSCT